MTREQILVLADQFIRSYFAKHHPPAAPDAPPLADNDFVLTFVRVEPHGAAEIMTLFGSSIPFQVGDNRVMARVRRCIQALHTEHPAVRACTFQMRVDNYSPESPAD